MKRERTGSAHGNSKNMRIVAMALVTMVLLGGFCISPGWAVEPKSGGTLRFGTENDFAGFEVLKSSSRLAINGAIAANTILEPLFRMDNAGRLIPVLGLSATPSDDKTTWTIALRKGVLFHDGTPFTADAVVHHWSRLLNPENKYRGRSAVGPITRVAKMDDHTVQFQLNGSGTEKWKS